MKICSNCGAANANAAKFCSECVTALAPAESLKSGVVPRPGSRIKTGSIDAAALARSLTVRDEVLHGKRKADVMFVLDCTGSMQGEIDAIKDAITDFANTIKSDGVRVRVGLIEFRDRLIGEEARVLDFAGSAFTQDPEAFRRGVFPLVAKGGGDEPESSLDAVMLALRQRFEHDTHKVIVLVTDAPPHIPDKETKSVDDLVLAVRAAGVHQFYLVMRTTDTRSQVYLKLLEGTRGLAFELGRGSDFKSRSEDFKRTLMALGKTISTATV